MKLFFYKRGSYLLLTLLLLAFTVFGTYLTLTSNFEISTLRSDWEDVVKFACYLSILCLITVIGYFHWRQLVREEISTKIPVTRHRMDHLLADIRDLRKLVDLKDQIGDDYFRKHCKAFLNLYNLEREYLDKLLYNICEDKVDDLLIQIDYELVQIFKGLHYIKGSSVHFTIEENLPIRLKDSLESWLKYYHQHDFSN